MTGQGRPTGWRLWAVLGLIGWLWTLPPGLALWGGAMLIRGVSPEIGLWVIGGAIVLILAPAFSWVGLLIAAPVTIWTARRGGLGPAQALAIGAGAGALAGAILGGTSTLFTAGFGAATLLLVWIAHRHLSLSLPSDPR